MKRDKVFKSRNDLIFYLAIAILPTIHFAIFYIGVNLNSVRLAFVDYIDGQYSFAGLKHFAEFFTGDDFFKFMGYLKNSVIFYAVNLIVGTPISLLFAFYIHKKFAGSSFFKVVVYLPQILSMTVLVIMFKFFASSGYPALVKLITGERVNGLLTDYPFWTVMIFTIWTSRGTTTLMYTGAFATIDDSIPESAGLDGANVFQEFLYIYVPLVFSTISTFLITGVAAIFTEQMNLFTFYQLQDCNPKAMTMGYYLYATIQHWDTPESFYPFLSALGLMLTAVTAMLTFIYQKVIDKIDPMK